MIKTKFLNVISLCFLVTALIGNPSTQYPSLAKSGNLKPSIVMLSPAEEEAIMQKGGVSVPEGFEATLLHLGKLLTTLFMWRLP